MIVDTSAIIAVIRNEPDAQVYRQALEDAGSCRISAVSYVEAACVVDSARDPIVSRRLDDLLKEASCSISPVTDGQSKLARQAYRDYGKGSGHPAQLNFGDCFAYALAKDVGEPLLFKGNDFGQTDISSAL